MLRALSLFSGIGGLDLAAEMAGIEASAFCEIEPFPVEVLTKRFPGVPIFDDVRKLKRGDIDGSIDIIHGGFPCQDLSTAGKQRGLSGERSGLWFEMLRVIHEFRPRYVLAENVRGAVNLALDTVYANLVDEGYKVYPYVIPASAVGAPHQRERLFVLGVREDVHRRYTEAMANPGCELRQGTEFSGANGVETGNRDADKPERSGGTLWPTPRAQEPGRTTEGYGRGLQELVEGKEQRKLWPTPVASDGSCGGIISPDDTYVQKASGLFRKINRNGTDGSVGLARMVKLWPTPNCRDTRRGCRQFQLTHAVDLQNEIVDRGKGNIGEKVRGQLNPDWVEQLMNFPEGWTNLDVEEPKEWQGWPALLGQEQYPFEFPRTTTGCKNRAKRLKALGNAVVPAQAYPFFKAIAEIERITKEVKQVVHLSGEVLTAYENPTKSKEIS